MTRVAPIPDSVTLHVPIRIVKRDGRKEMHLPKGAAQSRRTDNSLIKALARAFRWKPLLESGEFATIAKLAEREGIAPSYMTRVLRLTLLAPDIVEDPGRDAGAGAMAQSLCWSCHGWFAEGSGGIRSHAFSSRDRENAAAACRHVEVRGSNAVAIFNSKPCDEIFLKAANAASGHQPSISESRLARGERLRRMMRAALRTGMK